MEATSRDGNLYEPIERQLSREEAKKAEDRKGEPATETDGTKATDATGQTGRTPRPAKNEQRRTPTKAKERKTSALCAGGRGVTHGGEEEGPGAERTGGGKTGEQDDRLLDTTRLTVAKPPLP